MVEFLDPFMICANLNCLFVHGCQYYGRFASLNIYALMLGDSSISCLIVDEDYDLDYVIELSHPSFNITP